MSRAAGLAAGAGYAAGAAGAVGALGAAYWLCMSSYSQAFGEFPYRVRTDRKVVALTFDDGPNEPYTSQLADFLASRAVKATFFQVGKAVLRYPEVTRRLVTDGHVIGCHGFTHEFTNYLSRATLERDISAGVEALNTAGVSPTLYRPPWLLRVPALHDVLRERGLRVVSGEFCHALEVCQPSPEVIARRALAKARPGSILIFHDGQDGHEDGHHNQGDDEFLHQVVGAVLPMPLGDIPIWLGAYKPRILRLVGRKADGWLPSMPYLKPSGRARTGPSPTRSGPCPPPPCPPATRRPRAAGSGPAGAAPHAGPRTGSPRS